MSGHLPQEEEETIRDFHHWIVVARHLVHDSFTGDAKELQRLTMQAAQGMMLDHRLGAIERSLTELKTTLSKSE